MSIRITLSLFSEITCSISIHILSIRLNGNGMYSFSCNICDYYICSEIVNCCFVQKDFIRFPLYFKTINQVHVQLVVHQVFSVVMVNVYVEIHVHQSIQLNLMYAVQMENYIQVNVNLNVKLVFNKLIQMQIQLVSDVEVKIQLLYKIQI